MNVWQTFRSAILAGIAISCGCIVFLKVGGVAGAVLFTFGLLTVVHYALKLYTGTAGFVASWNDFSVLWLILLGNIVGCFLAALAAKYSIAGLADSAQALLEKRLALNFWKSLLLGIGCGFVMTTAVKFAREGKFLPLLFGVPLFIMCGFLHSIADAFYYLACPASFLLAHGWSVLALYVSIVIGNFLGCNLYRIVYPKP